MSTQKILGEEHYNLNAQAAGAPAQLVQNTGKTKRSVAETAVFAAVTSQVRPAENPSLLHNDRQSISGNPEHQVLFTIPTPLYSNDTPPTKVTLPKRRIITGDKEIDACLWLAEVCHTARNPDVLDLVSKAAARITTPEKEIELRYLEWLKRQTSMNPLLIAFQSFDMANIASKEQDARKRISQYNEAAAIFGSYPEAIMPTPAEKMVMRTVGALPDGNPWRLEQDTLTDLFARSVNPTTLTDVASELHYWRWLRSARENMRRTERPDTCAPEEDAEISCREHWVQNLLFGMQPHNDAEVLHILESVKSGLIDIGSVNDWEKRADVFENLLRWMLAS